MQTFDFRYEIVEPDRVDIYVHGTDFLCAVSSEAQAKREIRYLVDVCCDDADKIVIVNGKTVRQ